ncbi:hypothetical protein [Rhodanobacter sp. C01]|uniref:hypothetical protein n=1 Tax=Rhodanobacter sp. C01 TaxID=1945856 RepID=UPI0009842498|nr:hypothetical protein [Rhodanobacter sp. C01]OOG47800.1 hypothetical protein B0E50_10115 [Rhodanobacter sp. C01]
MNPNYATALVATLLGMYSLPSFAADTVNTLCASTDKVVFSCPLGNNQKVVSMCASGDAKHFYYAYGRSAAPELVYPPRGQSSDGAFMRSHLVYGGASGGVAYSFVKQGYKYIVYSISGTGLQDGGVIVQRLGNTGVVKKMQCQSSKIIESQDDGVIDATLKWKSDSQIKVNGLPGSH